jgi:hypothetical protein
VRDKSKFYLVGVVAVQKQSALALWLELLRIDFAKLMGDS